MIEYNVTRSTMNNEAVFVELHRAKGKRVARPFEADKPLAAPVATRLHIQPDGSGRAQ